MGSKLSLSFRILKHGQLVRAEKLTQGVIKIGKVPSAHLQLDDESVSRMHAIIEVMGTDVSLIDLGSTRGTFVNGQRINKARLQDGDVLTVGEMTVELAIAATDTVLAPAPAMSTMTMPVAATPVAPPPMPVVRTAPQLAGPQFGAPQFAAPIAAPAPFAMTTDADDAGGARAVEIAAMLGDSVVSVKHCMDPRGGKVTAKTWGFAAAGLACLLSSGVAFAVSVNDAATNKGALDYHTRVAKKPAYSFRPVAVHAGLDYLAFGGLALGLLGVTAALARMRNEKKSPFYRVGTAPGVEQPLETSPSPSFPLVAPSGDDFVFNYGAGIDGEMTVDGTTTPLSELAARGRARSSATHAGAIEVPIPPRARIRARSGNTTFLVSAVAKPRAQATPLFNFENRTMAYFAGSLAVHMGVWAFLQTVPMEEAGVNIDLASGEAVSMNGKTTEKEEIPPEEQPDPDTGNSGGSEGQGAKMALEEGASGKPSDRKDGHIQIKDNNHPPQLSRAQAVEIARATGILGSASSLSGGITSLAANSDFSSGFDSSDIDGPLFGAEGEGNGNFGGGVHGFGKGGGCSLPPCGIIGTGAYGTIGTGDKAGDGWGGPGTGKGPLRKHVATGPDGFMGRPTSEGDLDKSIIKRYIQRSVAKIAYCYEKELLAKPGLAGTVAVQFLIAPNGTVQASNGSGLDGVSTCVAGVIKNIKFPAPKNGGNVQVNYPFNFHAAGQ
jgi:hypothetical protein